MLTPELIRLKLIQEVTFFGRYAALKYGPQVSA
jgi:hypothetical protein